MTRSDRASIVVSRLPKKGRTTRISGAEINSVDKSDADGVSGADLVVTVSQSKKGPGQKKDGVPWKKAFSDDILDKPCCLPCSQQYGLAKHTL